MQELISKLMKTEEAPGDYIGKDGLLFCGKCHTPKQTRLRINPATGDKVETVVRAVCQCQREADEAADRRAERERFKLDTVYPLPDMERGCPHYRRQEYQ